MDLAYSSPYNWTTLAYAYISARNDSLKLDPSIGYSPPVQYTLRAQTWSFVNNDTKSKSPIRGISIIL
jgi:hypothetical protein